MELVSGLALAGVALFILVRLLCLILEYSANKVHSYSRIRYTSYARLLTFVQGFIWAGFNPIERYLSPLRRFPGKAIA